MGFAKASAFIYITRVANVGLSLLRNVIVAAALEPAGLGLYSIILQTSSVLCICSNLGLAVSSVYYIGRKKSAAGEVIVNAGFLRLVAFIVICLVFLGSYPLLRVSALKGVGPVFLPLILMGALMDSLWNYAQRILLALDGVVDFCLSSLFNSIGWVLVNFVLSTIGLLDVRYALLTWIFSTLPALGWTSVAVVRRSRLALILDWPLMRGLAAYGMGKHVGVFVQFLNYRLDSFFLNMWVGTAQVGYYAAATQIAETLRILPVAVHMILLPRLATIGRDKAGSLTSRVAMWSLILGSGQVLLLLLGGRTILSLLYGADFFPAMAPLPYLVVGVGVMMISVPFSAYLSTQGYVLLDTLSQIVAAVFTIALDILLIPFLGIEGAAIASLVAYICVFCVLLIAFTRVSRLGLRRAFHFEKQDLDLLTRLF
jgi:stage V sporulation protein B